MSESLRQILAPANEVFRIQGQVQHYAWGGYEFIPRLVHRENPDQDPFAELWMGAHPKAPAVVEGLEAETTLDQLISQDPEGMLGKTVADRFDQRLPFLFKVLDVRQMLSIQVHPTKAEAEKGFARENKEGIPIKARHRNYRDDNHKPEIMVALTDFWLLHGFRSEEEIEILLTTIPEFMPLQVQYAADGIRGLYQHIMDMPQAAVNEMLKPLADRLVPAYQAEELSKSSPDFWAARAITESVLEEGDLDRGIFSIYFFNLANIPVGKGIFQDAGIPHAYLEGVNMELMANSDNVLRGGLTPKHIDVPELLKHTHCEPIIPNILEGVARSETELVYESPAPDFELSEIQLEQGNTFTATAPHAPAVVFVLEGEVEIEFNDRKLLVNAGESFFAPASATYTLSTEDKARLFKASVPA